MEGGGGWSASAGRWCRKGWTHTVRGATTGAGCGARQDTGISAQEKNGAGEGIKRAMQANAAVAARHGRARPAHRRHEDISAHVAWATTEAHDVSARHSTWLHTPAAPGVPEKLVQMLKGGSGLVPLIRSVEKLGEGRGRGEGRVRGTTGWWPPKQHPGPPPGRGLAAGCALLPSSSGLRPAAEQLCSSRSPATRPPSTPSPSHMLERVKTPSTVPGTHRHAPAIACRGGDIPAHDATAYL
jgi:hypothetical protein